MSHVPVSTIEMSTSMRKKRADQRSSITILVLGDGRSFVFWCFLLLRGYDANAKDLPLLEAILPIKFCLICNAEMLQETHGDKIHVFDFLNGPFVRMQRYAS